MQEEVTTAATKVFGSGWAWLCLAGKPYLEDTLFDILAWKGHMGGVQ